MIDGICTVKPARNEERFNIQSIRALESGVMSRGVEACWLAQRDIYWSKRGNVGEVNETKVVVTETQLPADKNKLPYIIEGLEILSYLQPQVR